jgi:rSAM-associated Gly-rich repeat protein
MSTNKRIAKVLALLIPTGVLGISSALAATQVRPETTPLNQDPPTTKVADRLADIRKAVSSVNVDDPDKGGPAVMLAEWLNVGGGLGWRNGGWGNGGWHNWGNGWHNGGWHNGGWHNWGNGGWHNWGNGWHNFWHNW